MLDKLEYNYCPLCGGELGTSKNWNQLYPNGNVKECESGHLFHQHAFAGDERLNYIYTIECHDCKRTVPHLVSRDYDKRHYCKDCYQVRCDAWQMDPKTSFYKLIIEPIHQIIPNSTETVIFHLQTEIKTYPYPNITGCGGSYGLGIATTETELKQEMDRFKEGYVRFKINGMPEPIIEWKENRYITSQAELMELPQAEYRSQEAKVLQPMVRQPGLFAGVAK